MNSVTWTLFHKQRFINNVPWIAYPTASLWSCIIKAGFLIQHEKVRTPRNSRAYRHTVVSYKIWRVTGLGNSKEKIRSVFPPHGRSVLAETRAHNMKSHILELTRATQYHSTAAAEHQLLPWWKVGRIMNGQSLGGDISPLTFICDISLDDRDHQVVKGQKNYGSPALILTSSCVNYYSSVAFVGASLTFTHPANKYKYLSYSSKKVWRNLLL